MEWIIGAVYIAGYIGTARLMVYEHAKHFPRLDWDGLDTTFALSICVIWPLPLVLTLAALYPVRWPKGPLARWHQRDQDRLYP